MDFGVLGDPPFPPDVTNDEVARAGGGSIAALRASKDKAEAMRVMTAGLAKIVSDLYAAGRLDGILGMAGSGGTSLATAAMRELPIGVPKVMASTVGGGDVSQYVGAKDITMMPSVVDVAGINSISRRIYANAAAAIAGMVEQDVARRSRREAADHREHVRQHDRMRQPGAQPRWKPMGYEVLVFHATGTGGRTMEALIAGGYITANLDLTTTELADYVCGGAFSAGPDRMMAAARAGVPTVLAPGCVDMCNFWAIETVPEKYRARNLYQWNPNVTLMRTNVEENIAMGEMIARGGQRVGRAGRRLAAVAGRLSARQPRQPLLGSRRRWRVLRRHPAHPETRHPPHRAGRQHQRPGLCRQSRRTTARHVGMNIIHHQDTKNTKKKRMESKSWCSSVSWW